MSERDHWHCNSPSPGAARVGLAADMKNESAGIACTDGYYIKICGCCGHKLSAYHTNYTPATRGEKCDSGDFGEIVCPRCFSANYADTSVIAAQSFLREQERSSEWWKLYIKTRADQALWSGELGEYKPRGPFSVEPIGARKTILSDVGIDWEPACPACRASYGNHEFDFHHWDYENDIGCTLCRDCHNYIHNDTRASEQAERNGSDWRIEAVDRLLSKTKETTQINDKRDLISRFNIPRGGKTEAAIENEKPELMDYV